MNVLEDIWKVEGNERMEISRRKTIYIHIHIDTYFWMHMGGLLRG